MADTKDPLLLDHNYDGIQELDNPLPRWWIYLFYLTFIFGLGYIWFYTFGPGLSQEDALAKRIEKLTPTSEKKSDATSLIAYAKSKEALTTGSQIFNEKCAMCHGQNGEGLIGPNLTDEYWIHGDGSISAIIKVVTEGVPEKGMLAWDTQLSEKDIAAVSGYVDQLKGSNPANAKAPQGTKIN